MFLELLEEKMDEPVLNPAQMELSKTKSPNEVMVGVYGRDVTVEGVKLTVEEAKKFRSKLTKMIRIAEGG